ncbi:MAG TPA: CmcJ/NvfI family oxidoreductase, partial [Steroidobacteraceae bacterium]
MIANSHPQDGTVRGSVHYAAAGDRQLFYYAYAPHGVEETNIEFVEHVVDIRDVRQSRKALQLEVEGASVLTHRSAVQSFYDAHELRRVGYPETADLVRSATGAAEVVVFDHNIRHGGDRVGTPAWGEVKRPVFHIHTDFSDKSARARASLVLGKPVVSDRRMAAINVWRPIVEPLRDCPLAICDASSIDERDLREADLLYPDRTGQIYYVTFNPAHIWYYASNMRTDEVWIFKNYDSAADGRARYTPHTAFMDPTHHPAVPARESVEFRTFAF